MRWGRRWHTIASVLFVVAIFAFIPIVVIVGNASIDYTPKVTKTSENTWHIEAPKNNPEDFVDRTCQKDGKRVIQLHAPTDVYDELNVVCSP